MKLHDEAHYYTWYISNANGRYCYGGNELEDDESIYKACLMAYKYYDNIADKQYKHPKSLKINIIPRYYQGE